MKSVLKFGAEWCQGCKALDGSLKHANLGDVELVEIDIDDNMEKAQQYNIRGVPTMVLVEDGVEVKRQSGVLMADQIEEFIK